MVEYGVIVLFQSYGLCGFRIGRKTGCGLVRLG